MNDILHWKKCIRDNIKELNECVKYMDKSQIEAIVRWSAWINKDANLILDSQKNKSEEQ